MITETITLTLPPNLTAAARLDALTHGEDVRAQALRCPADSFHHEVQAGHFPNRDSDKVIQWLLEESPADNRIRKAEEQLLRRVRELAAASLVGVDAADRAAGNLSKAIDEVTGAIINAQNEAQEQEVVAR